MGSEVVSPASDTDSKEVLEEGRHSRGWNHHRFVLEESIALMTLKKKEEEEELTESPKCLWRSVRPKSPVIGRRSFRFTSLPLRVLENKFGITGNCGQKEPVVPGWRPNFRNHDELTSSASFPPLLAR